MVDVILYNLYIQNCNLEVIEIDVFLDTSVYKPFNWLLNIYYNFYSFMHI